MRFTYHLKDRKLNRMRNYDYNQQGFYFVTFCTHNRIKHFGEVVEGTVVLSKCGEMAEMFWEQIPRHYPNVKIDEYIVMPNHMHGIVVITHDTAPDVVGSIPSVGTKQCFVPTAAGEFDVPMGKIPAMEPQKHWRHYGLLSKVVKSFKDVMTKNIRANLQNINFQWQRSFHDRIIRNEKALFSVRAYIRTNPLQWQFDRNFITI